MRWLRAFSSVLGTLQNDDGAGRRERENEFFHVAVSVPLHQKNNLMIFAQNADGYQSGNINNVGQLKHPAQTLFDSLLEDQIRYFLC